MHQLFEMNNRFWRLFYIGTSYIQRLQKL
uniref:Uncharacterized protein n=1 Tax=Arundo donax TaxID=35708 RepID=A0A0A9A4P9_ARUDO